MTRSCATEQEARCVQAVRVELAPGLDPRAPQTDPADFSVLAEPGPPLPMVLEFGLVCDRAPVPPETDFELDVPFWQRFGAGIWPIP